MRKSTHTTAYASIRRALADLRTAAGLSQRRLAAQLQVPHSWVAKIEAGERRIDLLEFAWFCAACGASPPVEAARVLTELGSNAGANRQTSARRKARGTR